MFDGQASQASLDGVGTVAAAAVLAFEVSPWTIHALQSAPVSYFAAVKAPKKEVLFIEHAGHFAFLTHAAEFLALLTSKVKPVAVSRGA